MPDKFNESEQCPCGSGRQYAQCCGPFHADTQLPPTAEALMRSRYSAYVLRDEAYLLNTWHPSTRPPAASLKLAPNVKWLGLRIKGALSGGQDAKSGQVEFVARFKIAGKAEKIRENSRFVREQDRWYYLDGDSSVD